jgi:hypothetical protein
VSFNDVNDSPSDLPDPGIPPALAEALRRTYGRMDAVAPGVDDAVLSRARLMLSRRRRMRRALGWGASAAALAACIAAAIHLGHAWHSAPAAPARTMAFAPEDVNRDGTIDIRDALFLAHQLQKPGAKTPAWDINQDGAVDQKDVDAIGSAAVKLK